MLKFIKHENYIGQLHQLLYSSKTLGGLLFLVVKIINRTYKPIKWTVDPHRLVFIHDKFNMASSLNKVP